jgi:5'-nucleotidase
MKILLVNDDGYQAEGIRVLEDVLSSHGHEVWVCAPTTQRSACSHSMTINGGVVMTRYGVHHFHCNGYPADCVLYSLKGGLFPSTPDVVVSGVNHGFNISTDTLYSGTIGAASEGALMGIPSFAVSCQKRGDRPYPFRLSATFLADHLETFLPLCSDKCFISINVPADATGAWKASGLSFLDYHDEVKKRMDKDGDVEYKGGQGFLFSDMLIVGGSPSQRYVDEDADFVAVGRSFISVSALSVLFSLGEKQQEALHRLQEAEGV